MPLYAYKCVKCGHEFEKIEKLDAPHRQKCPRCKGRAERQLAAPAIQFKGAGWYVTDYARGGSTAGAEKKETSEAAETSKDTKQAKEAKAEKPRKEKKGKEK